MQEAREKVVHLPKQLELTALESCVDRVVDRGPAGSGHVLFGLNPTEYPAMAAREFLLNQIAKLADTLAETFGKFAVAQIASAISDTAAWWP